MCFHLPQMGNYQLKKKWGYAKCLQYDANIYKLSYMMYTIM